MINILILSEDAALQSEIKAYLRGEDYNAVDARNYAYGQQLFNSTHLIIFDATHFHGESAAYIKQLKSNNPLMLIIVLVEKGSISTAVRAMRAGATDVLAMPIDQQSLLKSIEDGIIQQDTFLQEQAVIQQAIELLQLVRTNHTLPDNVLATVRLSKYQQATMRRGF